MQDFRSFQINPIQTEADFLDYLRTCLDSRASKVVISIAADLRNIETKDGIQGILQSNHRIHNFDFLVGKSVGKWLNQKLSYQFGQEFIAINNLVSLAQGLDSKDFKKKSNNCWYCSNWYKLRLF